MAKEKRIWNSDMCETEYADVIKQLNRKKLEGEIFVVGKLQRWDGRYSVYLGLKTSNIGKAVESAMAKFDGDSYFDLFIEDDKMILTQFGHDNPVSPSVLEFRTLKPNCDEYDLGESHDKNMEATESIGAIISQMLKI